MMMQGANTPCIFLFFLGYIFFDSDICGQEQ